MFGHFLAHRIHLSDLYVKHKFPCFRSLEEGLKKVSEPGREVRHIYKP